MTTLKVGDRIRFVGPALNVKNNEVWFDRLDGYRATVVGVMLPRHIDIFVEGCDSVRCSIHPRQVTHRLKPKEKKKPRERWLFEYVILGETYLYSTLYETAEDAKRAASGFTEFKRAVKFVEVIEG
jgi:hypothetical protein